MPRRVAIDTGPAVALFDRNDKHHATALKFFQGLSEQGFVTGGVVAEVMWLLDFRLDAQLDFLEWISRGAVEFVPETGDDWDRIAALMSKYADLPMDYADAAIVAACERLETPHIATLDSHFQIYRYNHRQRFQNLFPI